MKPDNQVKEITDTIPVIVERSPETSSETLGILGLSTSIEPIDTEKIRGSLTHLSGQISALLQDIKRVGDFQLKEVQLQVVVTAEGGVALIGLAKAGVTGAITLTFSV
jgi:hypothetical protein